MALVSSKAFVDYSTSGLENPLTNLLLALFAVLYLRPQGHGYNSIGMASLFGLALLNRMDLALVLGPGMLWVVWLERGRSAGWVAAGLAPFGAWVVFVLFYYGFPFPNTAYAKLGTGVETGELLAKGIHYVVQSCRNDPLTPLILVASAGLPLARRDWRGFALTLGSFFTWPTW